MDDKLIEEKLREQIPECKDCPHSVGDATERDCAFPNCGGDTLAISTEDVARAAHEIESLRTELHQCRDRLRWVPCSERLPIPGRPVELINLDRWLNTPEGVQELNIRACAYLTEWGQKYWSVQGERGQDIDAYTHWRYSPPPQHSDQEKDSWV